MPADSRLLGMQSCFHLPLPNLSIPLQYMSPEISKKGQMYGLATDVWLLGATLYELCTLHPLFNGANEAEVERCIAHTLESGSSLRPCRPATALR